MKKTSSLIGIAFFVLVAGGIFWSFSGKDSNTLFLMDKISHGHGLALDVANSNKLYVATHYGLLLLQNEKDLSQVGKKKDDYMGFSVHPVNPNIFYSSGHPATGGNIGFQKSEDGGFTWQRISSGANGPVDFHAMAVSPANPDLIYGWYAGALQKSVDGGRNWEILNTPLQNVISLTAHPTEEKKIYATTIQGVFISIDYGLTWNTLSADLLDNPITVLAIDPTDSNKLFSFSLKLGLAKSNDGGATWSKLGETFDNDVLLFIAFDKNKKDTAYTLTKTNVLYKTTDGGSAWTKIR